MRAVALVSLVAAGIAAQIIPIGPGAPGGPSGSAPPASAVSRASVVFRPNGATPPGYVDTWAGVEAALLAYRGPFTLYLDDSLSPTIVPGSANTDFEGRVTVRAAVPNVATAPVLVFDDGARVRNVGSFITCAFSAAPTVRSPILQEKPGLSLILREGAQGQMGSGASLALIEIAETAAASALVGSFEGGNFVTAADPSVPLIHLASVGHTLLVASIVNTTGQPTFPENAFDGDSSSTAIVIYDGTGNIPVQTLFAGTVVGSGASLARATMYTPGDPSHWENDPPTTVQQALDRIAFTIVKYHGPVYSWSP